MRIVGRMVKRWVRKVRREVGFDMMLRRVPDRFEERLVRMVARGMDTAIRSGRKVLVAAREVGRGRER